ncbi:MAG: hypothetical protein IPP14_15600 [Planctomycetes bacterium]|nr:hypothetical protein [Planctomycetota bacterium]
MKPAKELEKALVEAEKRVKTQGIFEAHAYLRGIVRNVAAVLVDDELQRKRAAQ